MLILTLLRHFPCNYLNWDFIISCTDYCLSLLLCLPCWGTILLNNANLPMPLSFKILLWFSTASGRNLKSLAQHMTSHDLASLTHFSSLPTCLASCLYIYVRAWHATALFPQVDAPCPSRHSSGIISFLPFPSQGSVPFLCAPAVLWTCPYCDTYYIVIISLNIFSFYYTISPFWAITFLPLPVTHRT